MGNQLSLFTRKSRNVLLVDTRPKDTHQQHIVNVGLEYAAEAMQADTCFWWETIPNIEQYQTIGFNVIFPMFLLNIVPFLRRHNINPWREKRKSPTVLAGGPGVSNTNNALRDIVDETFLGEKDGNVIDGCGWHRMEPLASEPVCWYGKRQTAIIELDRGCKWRCHFCEYAHVLGGKWRVKDFSLLKDQITDVVISRKIRRLTLRSANTAAYPKLNELMELCQSLRVYQGWSDIAIRDADRMLPWLEPLRITAPKIGVESFDEATRARVNKPCTDERLEYVFSELIKRSNRIHVFLIFGLPGDDYARWIDWTRRIGKMWRATKKNVRIDFSITNFNPCGNTPLTEAPWVDFKAKDKFLAEWTEVLKQEGFFKRTWKMGYGNNYGRHGRKEQSYRVIMMLRRQPPEYLTNRLIRALPSGVGRSMSDRQALRFLNYTFDPAKSRFA